MADSEIYREFAENRRRAPGGTCWADAIRNFSVESDAYVKIWVDRVTKAGNIDAACFLSDKFFLIISQGEMMALETYDFVEEKRCESYDAFNNWLTQLFLN